MLAASRQSFLSSGLQLVALYQQTCVSGSRPAHIGKRKSGISEHVIECLGQKELAIDILVHLHPAGCCTQFSQKGALDELIIQFGINSAQSLISQHVAAYKHIGEVMNKNEIEGRWLQLKGKIKEEWNDLTDDEFEEAEGEAMQMVGKIQAKYGITKEAAEKRIGELQSAVQSSATYYLMQDRECENINGNQRRTTKVVRC